MLVADDQSATSAVIARALSDRCDVALAASAAEALALAGEGIDLAILDVMLPDLDGFELCRRLKADERTRDVPVVFVTALEEAADETRGFAAGGADYITKPISPPVLRARVETQLELKRARDRLLQLASIDALTGVGNRRRFESVLHEEWQRAKRARCWLSLAMVDVDHFKRFNDRYGHARGDECLRLVARALAAACRRPADQIARYGGEEFALVLPDTDPLGARYALENALRAVRELRLEHAGSPLAAYLTVSIGGVSVMPAAAGEASDAMEAADRLLFEAKAAGRNRALHCDLASGASTCVPGESR